MRLIETSVIMTVFYLTKTGRKAGVPEGNEVRRFLLHHPDPVAILHPLLGRRASEKIPPLLLVPQVNIPLHIVQVVIGILLHLRSGVPKRGGDRPPPPNRGGEAGARPERDIIRQIPQVQRRESTDINTNISGAILVFGGTL